MKSSPFLPLFPVFLFLYTALSTTTSDDGDYRAIVRQIFHNYDTGLRPVFKSNTMTKVLMHFGIVELFSVDEVSKTFECQTFMEMIWKDEYLTWNPEKYGNTSSIRYPAKNIWLPDIILVNSYDKNKGSPLASDSATNAIIYSDGTIYNDFTAIYKATCASMDMSQFPFDEHVCYMKFTSWTYAGEEVDIFDDMASYKTPDNLKLVPNAEWDISVQKAVKFVAYDCCPNGSYPSLRIPIVLKRKPLYFIIHVILPISVTCSVCFIGMFTPSTNTGERTEKVFLGITTLLAVSLLMFSVSAQLPVTSNGVSKIGMFLEMYILTISLGVICTSMIMLLDVRGLNGPPLPKRVKALFINRIGKMILVYPEGEKSSQTDEIKISIEKSIQQLSTIQVDDKVLKTAVGHVITSINVYLIGLTHEKLLNKRRRQSRNEWYLFCSVLDRICLIGFLGFTITFTVLLFTVK